MEERTRLDMLFAKLLDNSCSAEESDELVALFSAEEPDRDSLRLLYEQMETPVAQGEIDPDVRERLQKRLEQILAAGSKTRISTPWLPVRIITGRFRKVAAMLILVIAGTSVGYLYFLSGKRVITTTVKTESSGAPKDILPGSTKAILTLGNGQKIVLDSTGDGIVAEQGNMNILKLDSGRLTYRQSSGKSAGSNSRQLTEDATAVVYNTLATPPGGQYQLTLPDGTKAWLDASSSIVYPTAFAGTDRKVEIKGQVYFEVAKDEKIPFTVKSGDMTVLVLGTRFNVNAYDGEGSVKTTLLDGSVKVTVGNNGIMLDPGQQAQVSNRSLLTGMSDQTIKVVKADVDETLAWKNGFFSFRRADIQTVMRQLCRWYNVEVKYEGEINKVKSFSGEIGRNLPLADVLNGLQLTRIHYRIEADKRLVILP